MLRRTYLKTLSALSTLPFAPDVTPEPRLPSDRHVMFWYYFRSAIEYERPFSTARSREQVVEDLDFEQTTDEEALRVLELADAGRYSLEDMPDNWRSYFETVEQELSNRS